MQMRNGARPLRLPNHHSHLPGIIELLRREKEGVRLLRTVQWRGGELAERADHTLAAEPFRFIKDAGPIAFNDKTIARSITDRRRFFGFRADPS